MKNAKKIVMGGVAALALVTASVMGTMAYFTSKTETVNNTFTVGNVNITLDETKTDALGNKVNPEVKVTSNEYNLLPGKDYTKDPTVHVAKNSEDCYLFVTVKDGIADIEADPTVATQIVTNGWKEVQTEDDGTKVYVYTNGTANPEVIKKNANVIDKKVFDNFTVKSTESDLSKYANATITVNGYAIQAVGFEGKTAAEIWAEASK